MLHPEEIESQQFEVSFRGYNTREVDEFLTKLHSDVEDMVREYDSLKKKIAAAELLAKDAKEHEEEFLAAMQADRSSADAAVANSKTEGERIIREARNAASGIMTEVRRRAGEISAESRRASGEIIDEARKSAAEIKKEAQKNAADIIAAAQAEADKLLFAAHTKADNTVKAAQTQATSVEAQAKQNANDLAARARKVAAEAEEYMKQLRASADTICRELDAELKNSAARITLLGRKIAGISDSPASELFPEEPTKSDEVDEAPETPYAESSAAPEADAYTERRSARDDKSSEERAENGGYFTKEYRQVMEELFGEDDDTYDYLDKVSEADTIISPLSDSADMADDGADETDSDEVTSEYAGFSISSDTDDLLDVFSSPSLDRIYKSPSDEDMNDILNGSN